MSRSRRRRSGISLKGFAETYLFGKWSNRSKIEASNRRQASLKRRIARRAARDRDQDARIDELELENEELRECLTDLLEILVEKGVIDEADLSVEGIEDGSVEDDSE